MSAPVRDDAEADFMALAWRDFIMWAADNPNMVTAYEQSTGRKMLAPPRTALDAMIDKATGAGAESEEDFVVWVTVHHWGADEAPQAFCDAMIAKGKMTARETESITRLERARCGR